MDKRRRSGDYDVGYAKPPTRTQFKPGNKAARGPRKKIKLDETNQILEDVFTEMVTVKVNGRPVKMSAIRAIIVQARNSALKGEDRGIKQVFDLIERRGLAGRPQDAEEKFREDMKGIGERLHAKLKRRVEADQRETEEKKRLEEQAKAKPA